MIQSQSQSLPEPTIEVMAIPAFQDNYIWLLRQGQCAAVVDPGDAEPVLAVLRQTGLQLTAILVTHHHRDHQGGVSQLLRHHPVPVYAPQAESITGCSVPLDGGESFSPDGFSAIFQVLAVPGHTRGHIAYSLPGMLFCGDTLFGAGCGKLFEGTPLQMSAAMDRIAALPDTTLIYCAHEYTEENLEFAIAVEPDNVDIQQRIKDARRLRDQELATVPSLLSLEKATNPFLRSREPALIAAARKRQPTLDATDPVQVFACIRSWRDEW